MSGQEDFGPLLEVLVTCVGAFDVISLFAYIFDRLLEKKWPKDLNNNDVKSSLGMHEKSPISDLARSIPIVLVDNIEPSKRDDDVIDSLLAKVNELETKVTELEIKSRENSMERLIEIERYRRSKSPSPNTIKIDLLSKDDEDSSCEDETNTSSTESRENSIKHSSRLITRDDEFRKTIKRSSSQKSHESREEELREFSKIEESEAQNMNDFVPITYEGHDESQYQRGISPIEEMPSCPIHGEIERSPEPGMSSFTDKPWGDIKIDAAKIRKLEKTELLRRSLSIEEEPDNEDRSLKHFIESKEAETIAETQSNISIFPQTEDEIESDDLKQNIQIEAVNVNEEFIMKEKNNSRMLVKQANVIFSEDEIEEQKVNELIPTPTPVVDVYNDPISVQNSLSEISTLPTSVDVQQDGTSMENSSSSSSSLNIDKQSCISDRDIAVRSSTPEPEVSMIKTIITNIDEEHEKSLDTEISTITNTPASNEADIEESQKTKLCINLLDRNASRSSSRLSSSKKSKSPSVASVASEDDYKEWFDKFDNHFSANLTLPERDDEEFDSDVEENLLMNIDDENLSSAEICKIEDEDDVVDTSNVSISVTLNLKKSSNVGIESQKTFKTQEFLEMERFRENSRRKTSIVPFTEEQEKNFVSVLHPEEFPKENETIKTEHRQRHEHLHNVGYNEWMKKFVDHHSSHLATSDSDSDSDIALDEIHMLPLFCSEKVK